MLRRAGAPALSLRDFLPVLLLAPFLWGCLEPAGNRPEVDPSAREPGAAAATVPEGFAETEIAAGLSSPASPFPGGAGRPSTSPERARIRSKGLCPPPPSPGSTAGFTGRGYHPRYGHRLERGNIDHLRLQ